MAWVTMQTTMTMGTVLPDSADDLPLDATETLDTDGDQIGNNADTDDDGDGIPDSSDAFPLDPAANTDTDDDDGLRTAADTDDDNDGVADASDAFPLNASESVDTDMVAVSATIPTA